jgi:hypothetical protein
MAPNSHKQFVRLCLVIGSVLRFTGALRAGASRSRARYGLLDHLAILSTRSVTTTTAAVLRRGVFGSEASAALRESADDALGDGGGERNAISRTCERTGTYGSTSERC